MMNLFISSCFSLLLVFVVNVLCYLDESHGYHYQKAYPQDVMVDVINNFGIQLLKAHNEGNNNNIALSPYGATSVLIALGEGVRGYAVEEIQNAVHIPEDVSVVRIGLRDIHRHLKSYFIPKEGFLAGLTLSNEKVPLNEEYKEILRFYGFDLDSFNNPLYPDINDVTTSMVFMKNTTEEVMTTTGFTGTFLPTEITTLTEEEVTMSPSVVTTTVTSVESTTETRSTTQEATTTEKSTTKIFTRSTDAVSKDEISTLHLSTEPSIETSTAPEEVSTTELESTQESSIPTVEMESTTQEITTKVTTAATTTEGMTTTASPTVSTTQKVVEDVTSTTSPKETTISSTTEEMSSVMTTTASPTVSTTQKLREDVTSTTSPKETTIPTTTEEISSVMTTNESPIVFTTQKVAEDATSTISPKQITIPTTTEKMTSKTTTAASPTISTTQEIADDATSTRSPKEATIPTTTEEMASVTTTTASPTMSTTQESAEDATTTKSPKETTIPTTTEEVSSVTTTTASPTMSTTQESAEDSMSSSSMSSSEEDNVIISTSVTQSVTKVTTEYQTSTIIDEENIYNITSTEMEDLSTTSDSSDLIAVSTEVSGDEVEDQSTIQPETTTSTEIPENTTVASSKNKRTSRSVIDYIIARYYDNQLIGNPQINYKPEENLSFLIYGKVREPNINFMTYDAVLPIAYIQSLNAVALSFPLDSKEYYLLLILPIDETGIDRLIHDMSHTTSLREVITSLRYAHVRAVIPSFMLKGYVILTPTLQKLGVQRIFEPRQTDFSLMTREKDVYVTNVEQAVTVTIRNYVEPDNLPNYRNLQRAPPVEFKADHPFLYFVMDTEIHVTLMAGKIVNPLNSRIR